MTNVVVFAPSGIVDDAMVAALPEGSRLTVVRWADAAASAGHDVAVPRSSWAARRGAASWTRMSRSALGRNLHRVSPFDHGRTFWGAVRGRPEVVDAVRAADLVVAGERDGIFAAWQSTRRISGRAGRRVVHGYPAARAAIAEAAR